MARRSSIKSYKKERSVEHEDWIAYHFGGRRSKSSGAAEHESGDVHCSCVIIECKMTQTTEASKPLPTFVREFEEIAEVAWESGKDPVLALRYLAPNSVLANADGWIDVTVMLATDMAEREIVYAKVAK